MSPVTLKPISIQQRCSWKYMLQILPMFLIDNGSHLDSFQHQLSEEEKGKCVNCQTKLYNPFYLKRN